MEKTIIYLGLEFIFGPIQKFKENIDKTPITGVSVIDNNNTIKELDEKINTLWCSLWSRDENEASGMKFDEKREKELAPVLLDLTEKLIYHLNKINDGSFEIEDMISDHLRSLI